MADDETARPTQCGREHGAARTALLHPAAEQRGRSPEEKNPETEDPTEIGKLPITWCRLSDAKKLGHRKIEDGKRVGLADAEMHAKCRRRNQPSAEPRLCNRTIAIENR
jgi:hypothetical protein